MSWRLVSTSLAGLFLLFSLGRDIEAQTLTVAQTLGKGKTGYLIAANALVVDDFSTLSFGFFQVVYGLSDRVDLYLGAGALGVFGEYQANVTVGSNVNLLTSPIVDISTFNLFTTPLHRRGDAASVLWFNSTVVSKEVKVGQSLWSFYSGYNLTVPLDRQAEEKLFTPPQTQQNIPLGVLIPWGRAGLFLEYDWGPQTQIFSLGVSF